ncbi:MAG: tetratricopeptide repeat protein [Candidatus Obscuribacterales bacterium]
MTRSSISLVSLVVTAMLLAYGAASSSLADESKESKESKEKDKSPATKLLEMGVELSPADKVALAGYQLLDQGKVDEAMKSFDEALRLKPNHVGAMSGQAVIYRKRGDMKKYFQLMDEVIKRDPRCQYFYGRASDYVDLKKWDLAIADFKDCIRTDNKDRFPDAPFQLACCYVETKRFAEALPYLNQYLDKVKDNANAYALRAVVLEKTGNPDEAVKDMKRAKDLGLKL